MSDQKKPPERPIIEVNKPADEPIPAPMHLVAVGPIGIRMVKFAAVRTASAELAAAVEMIRRAHATLSQVGYPPKRLNDLVDLESAAGHFSNALLEEWVTILKQSDPTPLPPEMTLPPGQRH